MPFILYQSFFVPVRLSFHVPVKVYSVESYIPFLKPSEFTVISGGVVSTDTDFDTFVAFSPAKSVALSSK